MVSHASPCSRPRSHPILALFFGRQSLISLSSHNFRKHLIEKAYITTNTNLKQLKQTKPTMCNNTDNYSKNSSSNKGENKNYEQQQQQDHKVTPTEAAQLLGSAIGQKAVDAKDTVVSKVTGVKDTFVDAGVTVKNDTVHAANTARSVTADKIGDLKHTIEPPAEGTRTKDDR